MPFSQLGLSDEVVRAVTEAGYSTPTPIQAQAIPAVLMGKDVLGCAQTGTGKTASFTLPMIDILASGRGRAKMPRSLIIEPTRELAAQVAENFEKYGKYNRLTMALLIGGVSYVDQEKLLDRGVDVLIATPGRLLDHFERGRILLTDVKVLVIDEADRMLDMGFIPDVEKIVSLLPRRRQTLFFSATMAPEIRRLADAFLNEPKEITVSAPASTTTTIAQHLIVTEEADKREVLRRLLRTEDVKNAIIFCNRKSDVAIVQKSLARHGFDAAALHGDMTQAARTETLEKFKRNELRLLIASDVAARGLDVADLSHVFNFDVPVNAEDYVHRIGRTGRAGKLGRAFTLAMPDEARMVNQIETLIGKEIPRAAAPDMDLLELLPDDGIKRPRRRGASSSSSRGGSSGSRSAAPRGRSRRSDSPPQPEIETAEVVAVIEAPAPEADIPVASIAEESRAEPRRRNKPIEDRSERAPRESREKSGRSAEIRELRPPPVTRREDEPAMIGLGDHVPAFLLRPVRKIGNSA
jgi:superfamily II DNA/RNA helicase